MNWRSLAAEIAAVLHTPIPEVLDMDVDDFLAWHREAARIAKARMFP